MKELMNKKWRTKDGRDARIVCVDLKREDYPILCLVTHENGIEDTLALTEDLSLYSDNREPFLIEVTPWDDIKIDDPVVCWDANSSVRYKRHFAGVSENGRPRAWDKGLTSFSADGDDADKIFWGYCRPATEAEITGGEIEE